MAFFWDIIENEAMKEKLIKICDQATEFGLLAVIFFIPLIFAFWQETYQVFDLNKQVFFRTAISLIIIFFVAKIFLQGKLPFYVNRRVFLFLFIFRLIIKGNYFNSSLGHTNINFNSIFN